MACACRGAGTDANVYIEMHGDKAFVGKTNLDTAANSELCVWDLWAASRSSLSVCDQRAGGSRRHASGLT